MWGEGPDVISAIGGSSDEPEELARAQAWRALLFDDGYGWLSGPTEYGGGGYDVAYEDRFAQVLDEFDTPDQGIFSVARGMVAPAVQEHGSAELKARYLRRIHRGELICAQLLSEPEAGSDLGGLKTRAVRDGDEWVVNGQKVWSSNAHVAQIGQLLARTDPDAPKHRGISMFLLDLDTPGVEVRPLRQMNGEAHFNEIFLSDVRVPHANMVGDPGGGWRAVITTLMNERHVVATGNGSRPEFVEKLFALARHRASPATRWSASAWPRSTPTTACCATSPSARRRPWPPVPWPGPRDRSASCCTRASSSGSAVLAAARRAGLRRRQRRVGHLRLVGLPERHPGPAHRRWHRRDPAQHPGRAGPGPAQGARPVQDRLVSGSR